MLANLITRQGPPGPRRAYHLLARRGVFCQRGCHCVRVEEEKVSARVEGTRMYQVELWDNDGELDYECTCRREMKGISASTASRSAWPGLPRED